MKKILLATDFSEDASTAFDFSILLTQQCDGELIIIHTYTPPYVDAATPISMINTMQKGMIESYQEKLDKMVNTAIEIGISATSELVISSVATGVENTVDEKNIDYLVIGKTGDTGFLAKLVGNNATDIIESVRIPTFVIPKEEEAFITVKQMLYATQLEFDEFVARENLMQNQINMWELIHQLEYTQGNQRLRVYAEIAEMQQRIQALIVQILELDLLYHNPDAQ